MPFLLSFWLDYHTCAIFVWAATGCAADCVHELSPRPGGHTERVCFPAGPDRILPLVHQSCRLGRSTALCLSLDNHVFSNNSWTLRKCDKLYSICYGDFYIWHIFSGMSYCFGVHMATAWQSISAHLVNIFHPIKTRNVGSSHTNNKFTMENKDVCYIFDLPVKLFFLNKWF